MRWKKFGGWMGVLAIGATLSAMDGRVRGQNASAPQPEKSEQGEAAPATKITPQQAKELFRSVDLILRFSSEDSKLPIRSKVKRRLTTRDAVEAYILDKLKNDEDAKRMQRGEIVLKKFGLLDQDFQLGPFMVSLLKEQIAGYYDDKTKTVNLLDWIAPEQQKSVLAHELTHALQDQRVNLEKWQMKTQTSVARNVAEDNQHLSTDEDDTARDAVLEGQAMAVYIDWELKPSGRSLLTSGDEVTERMDQMDDASDSPVLARAPLLLQQSLLFPYKQGLSFENAILQEHGVEAAFAGVLDRPPSTSYEVMNPKAYEQKVKVPLLRMPDVHSLLDAEYEPYDIGVMGQLDVRILSELFGGPAAATALTPEWNGGIYFAAQRKSAHTAQEKAATASLSLLYLSDWKTEQSAQAFADMYGKELIRKYKGVTREEGSDALRGEQVFKTNEGPVLIAVNGTQVFVSESFDMTQARKLELLMTGAQQSDQYRVAELPAVHSQELSSSMRSLLGRCGMMRAALPH